MNKQKKPTHASIYKVKIQSKIVLNILWVLSTVNTCRKTCFRSVCFPFPYFTPLLVKSSRIFSWTISKLLFSCFVFTYVNEIRLFKIKLGNAEKKIKHTLLKVKSARKEFSLKNATNIPVRLESIANSQQRQDLIIGLVFSCLVYCKDYFYYDFVSKTMWQESTHTDKKD